MMIRISNFVSSCNEVAHPRLMLGAPIIQVVGGDHLTEFAALDRGGSPIGIITGTSSASRPK